MTKKKHNQVMILAAGVGSRLDPLTQGLPKPLAPILGIPVMDHIIALCKKHGFTNMSANINVMVDKMQEHFKDTNKRFGTTLNMVQEKELTGVAGGIRSCKKYLTQDVVLIIMGDAITDADLSALYESHVKSKCPITIGMMEVEDTTQFGVVVADENNKVISFQEKPSKEEAKSNLANTGIYLFNQSILQDMPSFEEAPKYDVAKDIFPKLMASNTPIQAIKINGYWADIGTLKQYQLSIKDALEGKIKMNILGEKTSYGYKEKSAKVDPSVKILGKAYIGKNVEVGKDVVLSGTVCIEKDCKIGDGSYIDNSVVWEKTNISKNAKVINSILGNNCNVYEGTEVISNSAWAPNANIEKSSQPSVVLK